MEQQEPKINADQALQLVAKVCSEHQGSLEVHKHIQASLKVLHDEIKGPEKQEDKKLESDPSEK
jgi:hypothetical protein